MQTETAEVWPKCCEKVGSNNQIYIGTPSDCRLHYYFLNIEKINNILILVYIHIGFLVIGLKS